MTPGVESLTFDSYICPILIGKFVSRDVLLYMLLSHSEISMYLLHACYINVCTPYSAWQLSLQCLLSLSLPSSTIVSPATPHCSPVYCSHYVWELASKVEKRALCHRDSLLCKGMNKKWASVGQLEIA